MSAAVYQRTCRLCKKSHDEQIPNLQESQRRGSLHHGSTEAPSLSIQEKEQHMDKCTRTDTKNTTAYDPWKSHKPRTL